MSTTQSWRLETRHFESPCSRHVVSTGFHKMWAFYDWHITYKKYPTFPGINNQLVVKVQSGGIVGSEVYREGLARRG